MAATVSLAYNTSLTVVQTYTGAMVGDDDTITVNQLNESGTLTASTAVPVTKQASGEKTLSGGAGTLDLTALPGETADETVDFTGLKVQAVKFKNKSTNANSMTVKFGASNPYNLLGASWTLILAVGQSITMLLNEAAPDVASGAKDIDISGTGSQVLQYQLVAG